MMADPRFVPLRELLNAWNDAAVAPADGEGILDRLGIADFRLVQQPASLGIDLSLTFSDEIGFGVPGLRDVGVYLGGAGQSTTLSVDAEFGDSIVVRLEQIAATLRVPSTVLKPVSSHGDHFEPIRRADGTIEPYGITVAGADIVYTDGRISCELPTGGPRVSLPLAMIGDTGIVIEADGIEVHLDADAPPPPGHSPGFQGVYIPEALIHMPRGLSMLPGTLTFKQCAIGSRGFSGVAIGKWDNNPLKVDFLGMQLTLKSAGIEFSENALVACEFVGLLTLPFWNRPTAVKVGFDANGQWLIHLDAANGSAEAGIDGVFEFEFRTIDLADDGTGVRLALGGTLRPLLLGDSSPAVDVRRITVDASGRIELEGGWLDLPELYTIDFHGFQLDITKLGFGSTADGGKWLGFTGGVKLGGGLPAGGSVEGLRITWYDDGRDPTVTLNGVEIELTIPNVLRFRGAVSYLSDTNQFRGAVKVHLLALDMQIDGTVVVAPDHFAIYVDADLPAGIPLFSTGLAVYGMAGLLALDMAPNRRPDEPWYESPDGQPGWYKRQPIGVNDLTKKWQPQSGSVAFGAGVTLGTLADNGFTFSGRTLLVIVFPGPVLVIEGQANLLRERDAEPTMRALAVLDGRAGNVLVGLDAHYTQAEKGELIDISGSAQAFFDFHHGDAWNVHLGQKDPKERRIRARLFQLFEANAYVALDAGKLALGAWIGYQNSWQFGPLGLTLEAWMDANAVVSIRPAHFYGDLWLHGKIRASAFGIGIDIKADARIQADVFDPFHIKGDVAVAVDLPWPLPDFALSVGVEWGPNPVQPPLIPPLQDVAIEHFKVTTTWPLPRVATNGTAPLLLAAAVDTNGDGVLDAPDEAQEDAARGAAPEVPLDARPHVTFARPVHDTALAGVNAQTMYPEWERVGDPAKNEGPMRVRYTLEQIALHKRVGQQWALAGRTRAAPGQPRLYGSWALVPRMPSGGGENPGQVKLWLWSKTPFDYTRHSGRSWDEWADDHFPSYPCQSVPETPQQLCCSTDALDQFSVTSGSISNWNGADADPRGPGMKLSWLQPGPDNPPALVVKLDVALGTLIRKLVLPASGTGGATELSVRLAFVPLPSHEAVVQIRLARAIPFLFSAVAQNTSGGTDELPGGGGFGDLVQVELRTGGTNGIYSVSLSYDFDHEASTTPPANIEILTVTMIRDGEPLTLTMDRVAVAAAADWKCPEHPFVTYRKSRDSRTTGNMTEPLETFIDVVSAPGRVQGFRDALLIRSFVVEMM